MMPRFECTRCSRHTGCKGPIAPDRRGSDLLVVGESPGPDEEAADDPLPFIGSTGRILRATLKHITDQYTLTNAACCFGTSKPSDKQMEACSVHLTELISATQPKVIVATGGYAAKAIFGRSIKVTETVGQITALKFGQRKVPVVVNFHPSYLERMRTGDDTRYRRVEIQWIDAWNSVIELLQGTRIRTPQIKRLYPLGKPPSVLQLHEVIDANVGDPRMARSSPVAYDYETWGDVDALRPELNNEFKILVIGFATEKGRYCFPLDYPGALTAAQRRAAVRAWKAFLSLCESQGRPLVAHHAKYEHKCNLVRFGRTWPTTDTMIRVNVVDEGLPAGLEPAARRFGIKWASYKTTMQQIKERPIEAKLDDLMGYCGLDAACTNELYLKVTESLQEKDLEAIAERFETYALDLAHVEVNGMHVSARMMEQVKTEMQQRTDEVCAALNSAPEIRKLEKWAAGNIKSWRPSSRFNPTSYPQVKRLCLDILRLPIQRQKGKYTFNKETLEKHKKYPVVANLLELRSLNSMQSGFLDKWQLLSDAKSCVHTQYTQVDVVTGRLGSREPNLQNIPDHPVRRVFTSRYPRGWIIVGDFSQLEPRLLAGWSDDDSLVTAFQQNLDMHLYVAAEIFEINFAELLGAYKSNDPKAKEKRDFGKRMNLGTMYGQTEYGLSEHTDWSIGECAAFIRRYNEKFVGAAEFRTQRQAHCVQYGWVADLFGRRRNLPDIHTANPKRRAKALRQAGNFPIASTGNQFCLTSVSVCRRLFDAEGIDALVVGTVHDSIIVDSAAKDRKQATALLESAMLAHNEQEYWTTKRVRIKADISTGKNLMALKASV